MSGPAAKIGAGVKGRADWETPPWLFEGLHQEFGFTVDAAASAENAKLPSFWTEREDGLSQPWGGLRVFCNPPYGLQTGRWVQKAAEEVQRSCPLAVLLVPANTETFWWHDWAMTYAQGIRFVRRRIHFLLEGRRVRNGRPVFSSAVLVFRAGARAGSCVASTLDAPSPRDLDRFGRLAAVTGAGAAVCPSG